MYFNLFQLDNCPSSADHSKEVTHTFLEGDAVYDQVTSYDPILKEATIYVPAHNTKQFSDNNIGTQRAALKVIITKSKTVTVLNEFCIVEDSFIDVESFGSIHPSTDKEKNESFTGLGNHMGRVKNNKKNKLEFSALGGGEG